MGRSTTREQLLAAGVRLYRRTADGLLRGLTAGTVAQEAGYHRQTFYRYWDTQGEFVADLVRHVLAAEASPPEGVDVMADFADGADLETTLRDVARYDYRHLRRDPTLALRIGLYVIEAVDGDELIELSQRSYDQSTAHLAAAIEDLLAAHGRRVREPLTTRDLARLQKALLTGLLLQERAADDDPPAAVLYERLIGVLVQVLTEDDIDVYPAEENGAA